MWSSAKQCGHRGIDFARPVKASLYNLMLGMDQFKSFRDSMSLRYVRVVRDPIRAFVIIGRLENRRLVSPKLRSFLGEPGRENGCHASVAFQPRRN